MNEFFVEYMPTKSEELISDFYFSDSETLVLEMGNTIYYDKSDKLHAWIPYCWNGWMKNDIKLKYKLYYLITKDENQYNSYEPRDEIELQLKRSYPEIYGYKYYVDLEKNGDGEIFKYCIPHETKYTFTDLKFGKTSTLNTVIGRLIYSYKNQIKESEQIDCMFEAPFELIAKKISDVGFSGSNGPKTGHFLINGIRFIKKDNCYLDSNFGHEIYYFPERYPEQFLMIEDEDWKRKFATQENIKTLEKYKKMKK